MIEYVAGFRFDRSLRHVLLVRKNRPAWQAGRLNAIGGHVESGETPLAAMCREFHEEAGYHVDEWNPLCGLNGCDQHGQEWKVHFFYSMSPGVVITNVSNDEPIEMHKIAHTPDRLPNLAWLIPMALSLHSGLDRAHHFKVIEKYTEPEIAR